MDREKVRVFCKLLVDINMSQPMSTIQSQIVGTSEGSSERIGKCKTTPTKR